MVKSQPNRSRLHAKDIPANRGDADRVYDVVMSARKQPPSPTQTKPMTREGWIGLAADQREGAAGRRVKLDD